MIKNIDKKRIKARSRQLRKTLRKKKWVRFTETYVNILFGANTFISAAAMAYSMTLSFFPMLICIYTLLGRNRAKVVSILDQFDMVFSEKSAGLVQSFMYYVERNSSQAMLWFSLLLIVTNASFAYRILSNTIARMQDGKKRLGDFRHYMSSFAFAVIFLLTGVLAIIIIIFSEQLFMWINVRIPAVDISGSWAYLRFVLLAAVLYFVILGLYEVCEYRHNAYDIRLGALLVTAALLAVTMAFSLFVSRSVRYSVVYGSLATFILLMFYLYVFCLTILFGAVFNITMAKMKDEDGELV